MGTYLLFLHYLLPTLYLRAHLHTSFAHNIKAEVPYLCNMIQCRRCKTSHNEAFAAQKSKALNVFEIGIIESLSRPFYWLTQNCRILQQNHNPNLRTRKNLEGRGAYGYFNKVSVKTNSFRKV